MKKLLKHLHIGVFLLACLSMGCATIATFDQHAYVQVTEVKVEVLALMDRSVNNYTEETEAVEEVNRQLFKALEYERHRPKNAFTVKMWEKLFKVDSTGTLDNRSMIPSYWAKWKREGKQRAAFINEAKTQVAEGFDLIAELESQKIKENNTRVTTFLNN